jgi:DHA1 family multidrug/chloramphenicol efflux transport protein-like MFS transporter
MSQPLINISRKQAFLFAAFLVMYEFLTYIANDMIMPGMLQVVETFHGLESDVALSLTAYILGGASLQIFLGPVSDRFGRRPIMIVGAVLFLVFTTWIACSFSMNQFLIARFFEGMGLCFISVIGYATLQEIFEEMDAVRLMAMMANVSILAPLLGPLAGAIFVHYLHWRFIFVIIAVFSFVALWGLWRFMPESVGQIKRDGTVIARAQLLPRIVWQNYKQLLLNPIFISASIGFGLVGLPCVAWIGLAPVILVTVGKLSLIEYGLWQLPVFTSIIVGNIVLRRMTHHFSLEKLLGIGSFFVGLGLLLACVFPLMMGDSFIWLLPGLVVYFFGLGLIGSPLSRFILFSTHVVKGTASALMSMILMSVQAAGIQVANHLYRDHSNQTLGVYCFSVGLCYCGVIIVALFIKKKANKVDEISHSCD